MIQLFPVLTSLDVVNKLVIKKLLLFSIRNSMISKLDVKDLHCKVIARKKEKERKEVRKWAERQ